MSIQCVPPPMGHQRGFGLSASGVSGRASQVTRSGRGYSVFTLLGFCFLMAGCGASMQSVSTSSTPITMLQASPGSASFEDASIEQSNKASFFNPSPQPANAQQSVAGLGFFPEGNNSLHAGIAPGTTYSMAGFKAMDGSTDSGEFAAADSEAQHVAQGDARDSRESTDPSLRISASSLNFGNVTSGSSVTQSVQLSSEGSGTVMVTSATITGTGFSVSGPAFPVTLSRHQAMTLKVMFAPAKTGAATGTLTITSNSSSNSTATVALSGTAEATTTTTPTLTVSTSSLSFGTVDDDSLATLPVTLTSAGTAAVNVSSATVSGTDFSFSGATFPLTLNPQQAVSLEVTFAPTQGVAETGTLTIGSNSSTNPTATVGLSGTGQHWVAISWTAPSSSPVPITGYDVYRSTAGSSTYTLLNTAIITGTSYSDTAIQSGVEYSYYLESVASSGAQSAPSQSVSVTIP